MTIEEKAKRYDEAIRESSKIINHCAGGANIPECISVKATIEQIFPELKESEDERTRKSITEFFKNFSKNGTYKAIPDVTKCIAWLEKQGEQNLANSAKTCKDEKIREWLINLVKSHIEWLEDRIKEQLSNGQFYGKELNEAKDAIAWLERQGEQNLANSAKTCKDEQNPTEWSEDDETNASYICAALDCYLRLREERNNTNGQEDLDKARNWLYNKLKSLRPQSTWKPSDKQIEALESATENCAYSEYQYCLRELIRQLKKLKG